METATIRIRQRTLTATCEGTISLCGRYDVSVEPTFTGDGFLVLHDRTVLPKVWPHCPDAERWSAPLAEDGSVLAWAKLKDGRSEREEYEAYDSTETYDVGDRVTHGGSVYECNAADTTGDWNSGKWDLVAPFVVSEDGTLDLREDSLVRKLTKLVPVGSVGEVPFSVYEENGIGGMNMVGTGFMKVLVAEPYTSTTGKSLVLFKGDPGKKGDPGNKGDPGDDGDDGQDAVVDDTLTQSGNAADAKATGDALSALDTRMSNAESAIDGKQAKLTDTQLAHIAAVPTKADAAALETLAGLVDDLDDEKAGKSDISGFIDGAEYDSENVRINFKHGSTVVAYIDATAFVKDGMVEDAELDGSGNLVISFNTASGVSDPIVVPLASIFNPANYYNKTATDELLAAKQNNISDLPEIRSGAAAGATAVQPETGKGLSTNDFTDAEKEKLAGVAPGANNYILPKASASTLGGVKVGANLSIDANGVLSADVQSVTVDTALSDTSENPVQNKVVKDAIDEKPEIVIIDGYDTLDYQQDGLIAMWDGIENAGYGIHEENPAYWYNIAPEATRLGNARISAAGRTWTADALVQTTDTGLDPLQLGGAIGRAAKTIEIVAFNALGEIPECDIIPLGWCNSSYRIWSLNMDKTKISASADRHYAAMTVDDPSATTTSIGARIVLQSSNAGVYRNLSPVGASGANNLRAFYAQNKSGTQYATAVCGICAMRFYDRILPDYELRRHMAIDKARFGLEA